VDLHAGYSAMILLGIALSLAFPVTRDFDPVQRRAYIRIQTITLIAALLGAKIAVIFGDAQWPFQPMPDWRSVLFSGRSIIGALLFGFIAAEIAKPLLRYRLAPNDRFAMILPFSIGTGRIGCYLAGCCAGVPCDIAFATVDAAGVARVPAQLIEVIAQWLIGATLVWLWRKRRMQGRLFSLYLITYGSFRLISEFWRETAKVFFGFSAYQWMALMLIICGVWSLQKYRRKAISERQLCP
jgi:phosphatidylglycerol---prolipoprotein diacylglyceryl transferase